MIVGQTLSWRIVLRYTGRPVLVHVLVATGVVVAYRAMDLTFLAVPALPVTVLAATVGILLTFRNNSAYDRWWEARTLWGSLVNTSRTFARQVLSFLPNALANEIPSSSSVPRSSSRLLRTAVENVPLGGALRISDGAVRDRSGAARGAFIAPVPPSERASQEVPQAAEDGQATAELLFGIITEEERELVYAQIGFVNALRCHLRRQDPFPSIQPYFRASVVDALREEQNVPTAIVVWMSARLRRIFSDRPGAESILRLTLLDASLTSLMDILGACERIKNTPIPRQYDLLPRIMVRAYLVLLPLGVVADLGVLTPFVTAIIAFLFLAMDAVGADVEAPFEDGYSDTPMTALCRTIEINLRQMLGEKELPPALQPENGLLY
ncbi:MAG: bestrophin family ion channel [Cystobacter sp.]